MFRFLLVVFSLLLASQLVLSQKVLPNLGGVNSPVGSESVGDFATKPTKVLWRSVQLCKTAENTRYYPPTIDASTVYITCMSGHSWPVGDAQFTFLKSEYDAYIYALDKDTGATRWKHKPESQFATYPVVHKGLVFYTTNGGDWNKGKEINKGGGAVHALDAATGELKWSYRVKNSKLSYSYQVLDDVLYFSDLNGNLYAVEANTGENKWVYNSGHKVAQYLPTALGNLILADGTLYFGTSGNSVHAVDEKTGALKWSTETSGEYPYVFLAGDRALYLAVKKQIYTIDKASGRLFLLSEKQVTDLLSGRSQKVAYVPGQYKDFIARNIITDEEIWRFKTGRSCEGATVSGGAVLFPCYDGKLYALDAQTGDLKWSLTTKAPQPTVAVEGGVIYCTIGDGRVYAIK